MFCTKCGNRIDNTTRFCPNCGSPITNTIQPMYNQGYNINNYYKNFSFRNNVNILSGVSIALSIISVLCIVLFPFMYLREEEKFLLKESWYESGLSCFDGFTTFCTMYFVFLIFVALLNAVFAIFNKKTNLVIINITAFISIHIFYVLATSIFNTSAPEYWDEVEIIPGAGMVLYFLLCISNIVLLAFQQGNKKN